MPKLRIDSSYGIVIIQDLNIVYLDDHYANIYGYDSANELMSHITSFLDLVEPKHHKAARENYYNQIRGNVIPRGRTFNNIDRNGQSFTVFTIDHVIEWKSKPAIQVTVIDLTATVKAQDKLIESERKYKRLITASKQGIAVHKRFKPVLVNQAWVDLMHAPSIEYVIENINILDFLPVSQHKTAKQQYQDIIEGKIDGAKTVVENICFDGKKRYFSVYDNLIEWDGEPAMQAVIEDVTKQVLLEKELKRQSITDALTQIANRYELNRVLNEETSRFARYQHKFSIILLDLDYFKTINDKWGHQAGDKALVEVAKVIKSTVRKVDCVGRWGGEEFLVICPNTKLCGAVQLAEKLRKAIEVHDMGEPYSITASLGVASSKPDEKIGKLLKRADDALYESKRNGRNTVTSEPFS
ncbi:sensor domain-containing diguanylate cyclase [Vibrio hannami]|uniref:sensor domain-containing diguanylate cyclase n=1 Tax=Vibrio hannami TaxID=2717094 RepID=UPI00240F2E29|nr:sensor domain-containing diguanylate cyclase [Vibrio hannami]MDG3085365.1 sensor domain-containing diguanylate cyclase [Vibrio hannami]